VGVWFPDPPDWLSTGDTLDEAMLNGPEALELWAEAMIESGQKLPPPRSLTELKTALRNLRYDEGAMWSPRLKLAFL
jgi:predicted RNase H-like HicB family nuclease